MIVNTVKDGSGTNYFVLSDDDGRIIITPAWTLDLESDTAADDSDKSFVVPATTEWKIHSIWIELITTATVGDRQIEVQIQDGTTDVIMEFKVGAVQAASLTRFYLLTSEIADLTAFRDTDYLSTLIPEFTLPTTYIIRVWDNAAIDAAADDMVVHIRLSTRTVS